MNNGEMHSEMNGENGEEFRSYGISASLWDHYKNHEVLTLEQEKEKFLEIYKARDEYASNLCDIDGALERFTLTAREGLEKRVPTFYLSGYFLKPHRIIRNKKKIYEGNVSKEDILHYRPQVDTIEDIFRDVTSNMNEEKLTENEKKLKVVKIKRERYYEIEEEMIRSNIRFVSSIANDYLIYSQRNITNSTLSDFMSVGTDGLKNAIRRFDIDNGAKLTTYAAWWIKQRIGREMTNNTTGIRLPVHEMEKRRRIGKAITKMTDESKNGKKPSLEEIEEATGLEKEAIERYMGKSTILIPLYTPVGYEGSNLSEFISDDSHEKNFRELQLNDLYTKLDKLLSTLDNREITILGYRFGLNGKEELTLEEIGAKFNVTRERIRQIEEKAIRKLRRPARLRNAGLNINDLEGI